MNRIQEIEAKHLRKELPAFRIGDVVDVQIRIKEAEKERIQTFTGTVIARRGSGIRENFTVRRIVAGEGVERVFPLHAPSLANVIVRRPGQTRRAKLYYLRGRVGKSTKTKERREDDVAMDAAEPAAASRPAPKVPQKKQEPVRT